MTRRCFLALGAAACGTEALLGQTRQTRGREVIDKTIQALGGDGFRFMKTRMEMGRAWSFYREQITGLSIARVYTKYTADFEVQRQAFGKKMDDAVILTPNAAWEVNYRGARPLGPDRIKQFTDTTLHDIFYILRMRVNEPGMAFDLTIREVVENQPAEKIEITDSENRKVTVWIHSDTMLPIKQSFERFDPIINDRREEVTRYSKYREVGNGVVWPFDTQRERDGEKTFELYAEKVTVGEDMNDSMFALPPGVKILKK